MRSPPGAETHLLTLPYFLASSQKVLYAVLLGFVAGMPVAFLCFVSLLVAGFKVALLVGFGTLVPLFGLLAWKLHTLDSRGNFFIFADRIEWRGPPFLSMSATAMEHQVLRYADIGHMERRASSITLRHAPDGQPWVPICVRSEHLDPLWRQLANQVLKAVPEGAFVSMRPSEDQPPYYLPPVDPLAQLSQGRTVTGLFRIEPEGSRWNIHTEGVREPLVQVRRQPKSQADDDVDDLHWFVETPEGTPLARLWKLPGAPEKTYDIRGPRGEELGRLKVSWGFLQTEAELISGEHRLYLVRKRGVVRIARNGQLVAQLGGEQLRSSHHGQLAGELPYLMFSLAVTAGVMVFS